MNVSGIIRASALAHAPRPHFSVQAGVEVRVCACVCVHPDSKLRAMVNFSDCKAGGGSKVQSLPPTKTRGIPW